VDRFEAARLRGGHDWLFVGQMLPHKAHHDVIKALACARKMFDPEARLHLVGRESCRAYADALRRFVSALGLTGPWNSWARSARVSSRRTTRAQTCSFAARTRGVLCTAAGSDAPPTADRRLWRHGSPRDASRRRIVLPSKSPALVAAAVQRVLTDHGLCDSLVAAA